MANAPSKDNTGAVVVAFDPEVALADRLSACRGQVSAMLLVDNSPRDCGTSWLADCARDLDITLISNESNLGIAAALNQGIEWARARGLKWLLTLDQDTLVYDCLLEVHGQVFENCPERDRVAIIGSNYFEGHRGAAFWNGETSDHGDWTDAALVIASGSLVPLDAAEEIGPFREDFFVDLVDFEYCLRARAKGFTTILAKTPVMEHAVGEPTWVSLLGRKLTTPNHSALRHYYFTRNHLVLMRSYFLREPHTILATINTRVKEIILVVLREPDKLAKLGGVMRGAVDAVLGRMGSRA